MSDTVGDGDGSFYRTREEWVATQERKRAAAVQRLHDFLDNKVDNGAALQVEIHVTNPSNPYGLTSFGEVGEKQEFLPEVPND